MGFREFYFHIGKRAGLFVGIAAFFGSWLYCIVTYGYMIGLGLGWIPSAIVAEFIGLVLIPSWGIAAIILGVAFHYVDKRDSEDLAFLALWLAFPAFIVWTVQDILKRRRLTKSAPVALRKAKEPIS